MKNFFRCAVTTLLFCFFHSKNTLGQCPVITLHPVSQFDCVPNSLVMTSTAEGTDLVYQWQRSRPSDGGAFSNVTNDPSYHIESNTPNILQINPTGGSENPTGTKYRVLVTSGGCTITSNEATIRLNNISLPVYQATCIGSNFNLPIVFAVNDGDVNSYHWEKLPYGQTTWIPVNESYISGTSSHTLVFSNIPASEDKTQYRCKVYFKISVRYDNPVDFCVKTTNEISLNVNAVPPTPTHPSATISQCLGTNVTLNSTGCATAGGSTTWYDQNNNIVSSLAIFNMTPTEIGTQTYKASCTKNNCESPLSSGIAATINPIPVKPTVSITPSNGVVCQGATVALKASKENTSNTIRWYKQAVAGTAVSTSNNSGLSATRNVPLAEVVPADLNTPGTINYWVDQEANPSGCKSARANISFTVNPSTAISVQPVSQSQCLGQNVVFTFTATGLNLNYQWKSLVDGGNITGTQTNTLTISNISLNDADDYSCTVTGACGNATTNTANLSIASLPQAPIANAISACLGNNVFLSATGCNNGTLLWEKSDGTSINMPVTFENTNKNDSYIAKCKIGDCVSSASNAITIQETSNVVGSLVYPSEICLGSDVFPTSFMPSGGTFSVAATDATIDNVTGKLSTTKAGNYTVNYSYSGNCGTGSVNANIIINPSPIANAGNGATLSGNDSYDLSAVTTASGGTTPYEFSWTASSAVITSPNASSSNPVFSNFTQPTTITLKLKDAKGCEATANAFVNLQQCAVPMPNVSPVSINGSGSATLTANNCSSSNFNWYDARKQLITNASSFTTPILTSSTTYYVQCVIDNCLSDLALINVNVIPVSAPQSPTVTSASVCGLGNSVTVFASGCVGEYRWFWSTSENQSFNNSSSFTTNSLTSNADFYVACWTNGVESPRTKGSITFKNLPNNNVYVIGSTSFCQGETATLQAAGDLSYVWKKDGLVLSNNSQNLTVDQSGNYSVVLSNNGCQSESAITTITVLPKPDRPNIIVTGKNSFCDGEKPSELSTITASGYLWKNQAGTIFNTQTITCGNISDVYSLRTSSINGCMSDESSIAINVLPSPPTPSIYTTTNTSICEGESVQLNTSSTGFSYEWSNNATTKEVTISNKTAGKFPFSLKVKDSNGCVSKSSNVITIAVEAKPVKPTIFPSSYASICADSSLIVSSSSASHYLWNTGDTLQDLNIKKSGTFKVRIKNQAGCLSEWSDSTIVDIFPIPAQPKVKPLGIYNLEARSISEGSGYEWHFGGNVLSDTTSIIKVIKSGLYSVRRMATYKNLLGQNIVCFSPKTNITFRNPYYLDNEWFIYPNPNTGERITIETPENLLNVNVFIYDILGRVHYEGFIPKLDKMYYLSVPTLSLGNYVLRLSNETFDSTKLLHIVR